jgi:hypothetical protein
MQRRQTARRPVSPPTRRGGGTGKGRLPNPYSRTRIIAKAMILAAEAESPDGTLIGFMRECAKKDRTTFLSALMRVMPSQGWAPHMARLKDLYDCRTNDEFYAHELEDEDDEEAD